MTPRVVESDVIRRRLRLMEDSLRDLRLLADQTAEDLAAAPLYRAAAERLIPAAAAVGALADSLAQRVAPSASLRNLLVHRYADIRLDLLTVGIAATLADYPSYIGQISTYLLSADDS
jgi:hypothetical protein